MDLIRDGKASLKEAQDALYRDDPELVSRLHKAVTESRWGRSRLTMGRMAFYEDLSFLRLSNGSEEEQPSRPRPKRKKRGVTVKEMASDVSLWGASSAWGAGDLSPDGGVQTPCAVMPDREALTRLLQFHGWIEWAPFGRDRSRWFASDEAVEGDYGQTVDPSEKRSFTIGGPERCFPFPSFYPDKVKDIVWTLGWDTILDHLKTLATKKDRLAWLMTQHSYLPAKTISQLAGVGIATVKRWKAKNDTQRLYKEKTSSASAVPMRVKFRTPPSVPYDPAMLIHPILSSLVEEECQCREVKTENDT